MNTKIIELIKEHGFMFDEDLVEFAEIIIKECLQVTTDVEQEYNKYRRRETDFTEKNIFAEGEISAQNIGYKIKNKFNID